jgi:hypothetical protein
MGRQPTTPRASKDESSERITASLDAAVAEAERVGYVSAEEGKRRADALLKQLAERAAAGDIKP